jgi:hypothetical protein
MRRSISPCSSIGRSPRRDREIGTEEPSLVYGVGTALPVILMALFVAFGTGTAGKMFHMLSRFELRARQATGIVFMVVGLYLGIAEITGRMIHGGS